MNTILVTGDFLIDHHIYEGKRHHFGDHSNPGVCVTEELGGGALIHRLLNELQVINKYDWRSFLSVDEVSAFQQSRQCPLDRSGCADQPYAAYAFWRPFTRHGKSEDVRWRVAEAMGFGGGPATSVEWPWEEAANLPGDPTVLVISDGGMGFRSRMNLSRWRIAVRDQRLIELFHEVNDAAHIDNKLLTSNDPQWIVLKMSAPISEGDLWRELSRFHSDRLIVVVSVEELRRANVKLSQGLSWEQTLEDLQQALKGNASLNSLVQSRHLIIPFGTEAVLWLDIKDDTPKATFVFDPECVEGELRMNMDGDVYGYLSCLTAMVAEELVVNPSSPNLEVAMRRGLSAMRHLREYGHGDAELQGSGFPAKSLAEAAHHGEGAQDLQMRWFYCDDASCPVRPGWSLLSMHESAIAADSGVPLKGIARRVLIQGPAALRSPSLRVGNFFTADRSEIEAVRSLRQLVNRYVADRKADKPLSIGVFGPPGAGKSFAVKELAKSLLGDQIGWLEFNMSQFNGPADLIGALHQVRDKILEGKLPVAFFDEFDSQNFIWLKYLLAPMQDGRFQEGQISHPVGHCLFVFAGGTSHTFEDFESRGEGAGTPDHESADYFVLSKGPDFASRLDGKLNVIGPNPRPTTVTGIRDIFYPVRRALFIRSRLKCSDTDRLTIHPGLATALLELSKFRHGARSLTKLLEPFRLIRRMKPDAPLGLSSLPPQDQLKLQVDVEEFNMLIRRDEESANRLGVDKLAGAVHAFYRKKGKDEGWIKPHLDRDFSDLSPFDQASNRAAARRIPAILALVGQKLVEGNATATELSSAKLVLSFQSELLGEAEHNGWMDWHLDNGWTQSDVRNEYRQNHNQLVPYNELLGEERDKDKNSIVNYVNIAELAGMKIVPA